MDCDDRLVIQVPAVGLDVVGVVGGIHQVVEILNALRRDGHQRDGGLRIVHAGAGEQRGDGDLAVGDIEMEFIAGPIILVAAAIGFCADVALTR